jgi:hypothetical protein
MSMMLAGMRTTARATSNGSGTSSNHQYCCTSGRRTALSGEYNVPHITITIINHHGGKEWQHHRGDNQTHKQILAKKITIEEEEYQVCLNSNCELSK